MRLIDADALKESIGCADAVKYGNRDRAQQDISYSTMMLYEIRGEIDAQPITDIVRCKDCIHCGHADTSNLIWGKVMMAVFPDDICPCQCDDNYYSWLPDPDWFCANGERRVSGE